MSAALFDLRSAEPELMDDPAVDEGELESGLDDLHRFNRYLNGYATSVSGLRRLLPPGVERLSVLDVGAGGGETARLLADWGARGGLDLSIEAIDRSPKAVARARARGESPSVRFACADLFALPPGRRYDVVHAALLLHHFPAGEAARALEKMWSLCRLGVVVNDLHRHPVAYYSAKALASLSRSRVTRHDAPLSVLRAFRKQELLDLASAAGLPEPELRWSWAFRWQLIARR